MLDKKKFNEFRKKAQHKQDELLTILTLDPISIRLAYLIKKKNLNISPNAITKIRLFIFGPLTVMFLLLAPLFQIKSFYLVSAFLVYLMNLSDDLDGNLARGTNKTSKVGAFLDSIADRFLILITITMMFSVGAWIQNQILINGAFLIFVLKSFHMMVITKIFYYSEDRKKNINNVFEGESASSKLGVKLFINFLKKINGVLKIKRWHVGIGGYERAFITIILPSILIFIGQDKGVLVLELFLISFFVLFFVIRIINLLERTFKEMQELPIN